MIPLRDLNPRLSTPVVTYALIAVNLAVFLFETSLDEGALKLVVEQHGVVPQVLSEGIVDGRWTTLLSSLFLHGGWLHLLSNMWFLHVFGDNVEERLGHLRYLGFYLLCGGCAAIAQVAMDPSSTVPMVGASGAIAGLLGAYVVLAPNARIVTLVPIFIFVQFVELPAYVFIFVWFGLQLLMGWMALDDIGDATGGIAFFAHIGGFVAGLVLMQWWTKTRRPQRA